MRKVKCISLIMLALIQMSCVVIPTPRTRSGIEIDSSFIKIGMTTKEDILLRFGTPSWSDENSMTYEWRRVYAAGCIYLPYLWGAIGVHEANYRVCIQFDGEDIVQDVVVEKSEQIRHLKRTDEIPELWE